ncbi:MAG: DUF362 domain-containing protein [Planctomycetota bacterium]|nr:DUF362 domain-containing protein [Planctomycetota bacterium]
MSHNLSRRNFLRTAAGAACAAWALGGCSGGEGAGTSGEAEKFRARPHPGADAWKARVGLAQGGDDPARNTRVAVEKLCGPDGAKTFVRPGDIVVVKPNIGWAQVPDMAATVDPAVVATVVRMCLEAGAKAVKVFDNSVGTDSKCYEFSGIQTAAREAGADVFLCARHRYKAVKFDDPRVKRLAEWPIYEDALTSDLLINIAVAKTHNLSYVSLCMKNLMGVQGGDRGKMHQEIHQNLADLNVIVRPTLNILDATRVMISGGPSGGRRDQVASAKTIVCGTSAVTVDAWAADPKNLPWPKGHHELASVKHIALGAAAGLGVAEPDKIEVVA